jgi:peroxiredoxin Q/BCP
VAEQFFFSASRLTLGGSEGRLRGIHRPKQRAQGGRAGTNQNEKEKDTMKKALLLLLTLAPLAACAAAKHGEAAPDFKAQTTKGEVQLASFKGKWLVLYFYPKSFTPGCTKEACSLRDGYADIQKTGAEILGVSLDSLEKQKKFKAEYKLPFELVADTDKQVTKAFDVLGVAGLVASRYTFIIAPDGKIAHVFDKVDCPGHKDQVLETLKRLQADKK